MLIAEPEVQSSSPFPTQVQQNDPMCPSEESIKDTENKEQEQEKRGWVGRKRREEKKEKKKKNLPNTGIGQHGVTAKNLLESVFLNGWCMCVCLCYVSFYLPF